MGSIELLIDEIDELGVPVLYPMPKKLLDSSARNRLIYIGVSGMPSGLRTSDFGLRTSDFGLRWVGEGRRENAQTESKTCRLVAEMDLSAVRKNPLEPAQTRGSRKKKANRLGLAFKVLVEAAGIEPASRSTLQTVLHT